MFLASKHEQKIYAKQCSKHSIVIGSPFYYASRLIEKELREISQTAQGTIVLPLHSTHHVTNVYNYSVFIEHLKKLPEKYHPIHICMYWRNIQIGNHKTYLDEGFHCTTAGHIFDKEFLFRLLKILALHKYFLTNEFGTSPVYAAAMGLPVAIFKQDYKRICENQNLVADTPLPPDISMARSFNVPLFDLKEDGDEAQKQAAEEILGYKYLLEPVEMIKLFNRLIEDQQQLLPGLTKPMTFESVSKSPRFKLLQINDHQITGGAAKAGHRLFKGLLQRRADIHLITFAQPTQEEHRCLNWTNYFQELGCRPSREFLSGKLDQPQKWYEIVSHVLEHEKP
ncbi:MAG: hypothetical protein KAR20_30160, partial [Candidatus Heimdallarchaeota archaeon]|nr:hypothetical protein [Candidatus Heimdallarchaeota archaeon]